MVDSHRFTFSKRQRMVSRKLIDTLFGGGGSHAVTAFPLRAVYIIKERARDEAPVQLLISVPKKHLHHAVDRNRVKRQLREAYRRQQSLLSEAVPANGQLLLAFVWLVDRQLPSDAVSQRVRRLLQLISEKI